MTADRSRGRPCPATGPELGALDAPIVDELAGVLLKCLRCVRRGETTGVGDDLVQVGDGGVERVGMTA